MMKTLFFLFLLTIIGNGCQSSNGTDATTGNSICTATVVDFTDKKLLWPSANDVLSLYHLETNPGTEAWLHITPVTNLQTNPVLEAHLPDVHTTDSLNITGDPQFRNRQILKFYSDGRDAFTSLYQQFDSTKSLNYSECYAAITQELAWLATMKGARYLLGFTDLEEKSNLLNTYTGLKHMTVGAMAARFLAYRPVPDNLQGIHFIVVYQPVSRADDARFNKLVALYRHILEPKGVVVEVASTVKNLAL